MSKITIDLLSTINDIEEDLWNSTIAGSDLSDFSHEYQWLKVVEEGAKLEPLHFVAKRNHDIICVFPNFLVKIPNTPFFKMTSLRIGSGGPIILTDEKECLEVLFKSVFEQAENKRVMYHAIKSTNYHILRYSHFLSSKGYRPSIDECKFIINLKSGWDEIVSKMHRNRRRFIRSSLDRTSPIDVPLTEENIKLFYQKYIKNIQDAGGYPFPLSFFESMSNIIGKNIKIMKILQDGDNLGEMMFIIQPRRRYITAFFSAVDTKNLDNHAFDLLYAQGIRWGIENGYEIFDFGGTEPNFLNGIFNYKARFNGDLIPTLSWSKGFRPIQYQLYQMTKNYQQFIRKKRFGWLVP